MTSLRCLGCDLRAPEPRDHTCSSTPSGVCPGWAPVAPALVEESAIDVIARCPVEGDEIGLFGGLVRYRVRSMGLTSSVASIVHAWRVDVPPSGSSRERSEVLLSVPRAVWGDLCRAACSWSRAGT